ncbi:MAG: hypothetical protein P1V81_09525 [Planctomycetota bacterium]|nr:hypothetical protein [Planctomycetota bacterium]
MLHPISIAAAGLLAAAAILTTPDDFQRERGRDNDAMKDALEGRRPPAFVARDWKNVDAPLSFDQLVGQVVLVDFWGTW